MTFYVLLLNEISINCNLVNRRIK